MIIMITVNPYRTIVQQEKQVNVNRAAAEAHIVPYGITQCYLPPGDIPALTPAKLSWYSIYRPRIDARLS